MVIIVPLIQQVGVCLRARRIIVLRYDLPDVCGFLWFSRAENLK